MLFTAACVDSFPSPLPFDLTSFSVTRSALLPLSGHMSAQVSSFCVWWKTLEKSSPGIALVFFSRPRAPNGTDFEREYFMMADDEDGCAAVAVAVVVLSIVVDGMAIRESNWDDGISCEHDFLRNGARGATPCESILHDQIRRDVRSLKCNLTVNQEIQKTPQTAKINEINGKPN